MSSDSSDYDSNQAGFTLVEIMIVIVIVGILTAIAIPSYIKYVERTQITEGFIISEGIRNEIGIQVWENKRFPNAAEVAMTGNIGKQANELEGKYIATHGISVAPNTGAITVVFDSSNMTGKTLILTPNINAVNSQQVVKWICSGTVGTDNLPMSCQN